MPDRVYGIYGKQDLLDDTPWQLITAEQEGNGGSLGGGSPEAWDDAGIVSCDLDQAEHFLYPANFF